MMRRRSPSDRDRKTTALEKRKHSPPRRGSRENEEKGEDVLLAASLAGGYAMPGTVGLLALSFADVGCPYKSVPPPFHPFPYPPPPSSIPVKVPRRNQYKGHLILSSPVFPGCPSTEMRRIGRALSTCFDFREGQRKLLSKTIPGFPSKGGDYISPCVFRYVSSGVPD